MQTFLPQSDYHVSAAILDSKRLNKQIVQIYLRKIHYYMRRFNMQLQVLTMYHAVLNAKNPVNIIGQHMR